MKLLRRFGHTGSAGRLLELKALQAMDRGELHTALGYWQRLLADPWQRTRIDMLQVANALALCGHLGLSTDILVSDAPEFPKPELEPGRFSRDHLMTNLESADSSAPTTNELWATSFLNEANRMQETIRLVAGDGALVIEDELVDVVESWIARQLSHRQPLGGKNTPVIARDLVIVRDFSGVTARGARSGKVQWRYECETSLCGILTELADSGGVRFPERRHHNSAADLFARIVADDSVLSSLATDGERVYLIDDVTADDISGDHAERGADRTSNGHSKLVLRNRLLALRVDGAEQGCQIWSRGGREEDPRMGLGDFYFLGPPHPHDGGLYAIGEQDDKLQVVVLDAESGTLRWKQSLSLVELPVSESRVRSRTACSPLVSQGIVVCPTQLPVLVGLDELTGMLLWVYHAEGEERPDSVAWQHSRRSSETDDQTSQPMIFGNRLLFLPPGSRMVHCIDVVSGQRLWSEDARQAQYVACADDEIVMLVTARECIGLSLEDGTLQWRTPIDAPAGRGVVAGDGFLLPLNSGAFAEVVLRDGTVRPNLLSSRPGESALISTFSPRATLTGGEGSYVPNCFRGNLAIHDDLVVCCSSTGVSVFPQARSVLESLASSGSANKPVPPMEALRRAELHMRLAETATAMEVLRALLAAAPPDSIRRRATEHLRELLYLDISENAGSRLDDLAHLVSTPEEVSRYLLHRLEFELNSGRTRAAVETTCAIRDLQTDRCIRMDHNGHYQVVPLEYARFLLEQFMATEGRDELATFRDALRSGLGVNHESDVNRLRDAVVLMGRWSTDDSLSRRLAGQLNAASELQSAELLMLRSRSLREGYVPFTESSRSSRAGVTSIRDDHPSAPRVHQRESPSAIEYVAAYHSADDENRVSVARFEEPRAIPAVDIVEISCLETRADDCLCSQLSATLAGRSHFLNAAGTTVRLIDREDRRSAESAGQFAVFDPDGITELGAIDTPPARWRLPEAGRYEAGHLVPLQGKGVLMMSLLERRNVWHAQPDASRGGAGPRLGPYGFDFCVLQSGQELTVVDPVTGDPMWHRRGLRYGSGLESNEEVGIVGDSRVLVVFDEDRVGYELFETRSGRKLRRGQLPVAPAFAARQRTNFGRRLMYQSELNGVPHIRIWDPLDDRLLLDAPLDGRLYSDPVLKQQRVALLNGNTLKSIDGTNGRCEWALNVEGEHLDHVRNVLMFSHGEVDFVLLDRHMRDSQSSTAGLDIRIPSEELSGDLYAVNRESGEAIWNAPLPVRPSRVLIMPQHELPFLVMLSRVRDPQDTETYRLKIDVIDICTGQVIGSRSDLAYIPILHSSYDAVNRQLTLWGPNRHVRIGYSLLTVSRH